MHMKRYFLFGATCIIALLISGLATAQTWRESDSLRYEYQQKKQFDKAVFYAEQTLRIVEAEEGNNTELYADKVLMLAYMHSLNSNADSAVYYLEKELEIRQRFKADNPVKYEQCLNNLGSMYEEIKDYEKALKCYTESANLFKDLHGEEDSDYLFRLNKIALLAQTMNQYLTASSVFEQCLELVEKYYGNDHIFFGVVSNNLARLYYNMGIYNKALPMFQNALANFGKNDGPDSYNYGVTLDYLGNLYQTLGQYEKALEYYLMAHENFAVSVGKEHFSYGINLSNIGLLYKGLEQYSNALPYFEEAITVATKTMGKNHWQYGTFLNNLAGIYQDLGRFSEALPLYRESVEHAERILGKNHSYYGLRLNNLANLLQVMGRLNEALPLLEEVKQNMMQSVGPDHLYYSVALMNLARLHCQMKNPDVAVPVYREAYRNNYDNIRRNFAFLSENEKEDFAKSISGNFNTYRSFFSDYSVQMPELAADVYNIELSTKGMILQSGIQMRRSILQSGDERIVKKYDEWQAIRESIAKQYAQPVGSRIADLKNSEQQAEVLEAELNSLSAAFQQSSLLGNVQWGDVQKKLKQGEVAVEFASFNYLIDEVETGKTLYVALVLRPGDVYPQLVRLFEQQQLDSLLLSSSDMKLVNNLYRGITIFYQGGPEIDYGKRLYELVWKPIEHLVADGSTVYYSPSGTLHQIAFAAIVDSDKKLLSDRYQLVQLSTTAMLAQASRFTAEKPSLIALFGGIAYEVDNNELLATADKIAKDKDFISRSISVELERGGTEWNYLPGTLTEINEIAALVKKKKIKVQTFSGKEAVEESFKSLGGNNSPRIIHIATHGFFFPDVLKSEGKSEMNLSGEEIYRSSENPLNRAGLLFAGANMAWSGYAIQGIDDGILTAYEVSNVTLGSTQLVVLSACETGLGEIKGSEGVFGLQRAFKAAGAEYLMMSLWKVPDAETAMFMKYFYEQYLSGKSIQDSFHYTQQYMKSKFREEPAKWAAFVLVR